jgi:hypothetical protein
MGFRGSNPPSLRVFLCGLSQEIPRLRLSLTEDENQRSVTKCRFPYEIEILPNWKQSVSSPSNRLDRPDDITALPAREGSVAVIVLVLFLIGVI